MITMDSIKTKTIKHPMENVLDIESGTTIVEYKETLPAELTNHPTYDKKDDEIENQLEDIHAKAIDAFQIQMDEAEQVEGKYKARLSEVAANFLNTALNAIKEKSILKQHKDKLVVVQQRANTPGTLNQNLIIADRNEILKILQKGKEKQ